MDMDTDSEVYSDGYTSSLASLLEEALMEMWEDRELSDINVTSLPQIDRVINGADDNTLGTDEMDITDSGGSHYPSYAFANDSDDTGDSIINYIYNVNGLSGDVYGDEEFNSDGTTISSSSCAAVTVADDDVESVFTSFGVLLPSGNISDSLDVIAVGCDIEDEGYEEDIDISDDESTASSLGFHSNYHKYFM